MKRRVLSAICMTLSLAAVTPVSKLAAQQTSDTLPTLINTCLITNDVNRLAAFYAQVLKTKPQRIGEDYIEFQTTAGVLAIFSAKAQEKYIPGSARPGENHSLVLEFRVNDVDDEYARLHEFVKTWVKGPTNQPWGTRSIYFRDPDGNLIDFFTMLGSA